jgi:prenyltransferase beta subunit
LNQLSKINVTEATTYIASCQELDYQSSEYGGFYLSPTSIPTSLVASLDAVQTLSILESLAVINQTALLTYIASCEDPSLPGIFDTKVAFGTDEWVMGTGCALRLLELLSALAVFDVQASRSFLLSHQFPNGGWGRGDSSHDFHNSPDETWYAVQGLAVTGGLDSSRAALANYVADCCTGWGGATEPRCFGDLLTSWRVVSALSEVGGLSAINQSAFASYLANCWVIARSSVGWHQVPPNASMDTDTATPDRCIIESCTFGPLYHYAYSLLIKMLGLDGSLWSTLTGQTRNEIKTSQTFAAAYRGMFGLHHLYVGHETDRTFRFDTTCWNLLAYQYLGGSASELSNATAALEYLQRCLQDNGTHQYFSDMQHQAELPVEWRAAGGHLADTWLGLQAWAYLNPGMNGLDGHRLAAYAATYLEATPSIITAFYAADILHLLVELGLDSDATDFIDRTAIALLLFNCTAYTGVAQDATLQDGRWTPYVTALSLQLAAHLNLLPNLDVNPALRVTVLSYPIGNCSCGESATITVTIDETRWGVLPANTSLSASIFNTTFTNFVESNLLQSWNCTITIPYSASALGPQDLRVMAEARGYLPDWKELAQVCQVWGNLSTTIAYAPGLVVPRSVPLSVTLKVTLDGGTGPEADISNALVLLTNLNTSASYPSTYQGGGEYAILMPTNTLEPGRYRLGLEATAPYATKGTETDTITVKVYGTDFDWFSVTPTSPIAGELLAFHVCLKDETNTQVVGGNVSFCVTKPGHTQPWMILSDTTNASGVAVCWWTPTTPGQWSVSYDFEGLNQYGGCSDECSVDVAQRPSRCTAEWFSPHQVFLGNYSLLLVTVADSLNGSALVGRMVSFYEGETLLYATFTNATGHAMCSWIVVGSLGTRQFRVEVGESPLHDGWVSPTLSLAVRTTTTVTITSCTSELHLGETGRIEVIVTARMTDAPNGTASVYWDGLWQLDSTIFKGGGNAQFTVSYSDISGTHLLAILFGHLDAPDVYAPSNTSFVVEVLPVFIPTLTLTVSPAEIKDFRVITTFSVEALLTYRNGTTTSGLAVNVTLQLVAGDGTIVLQLSSQTDATGNVHWILSTPPPGSYLLRVQFAGVRGFAPASAAAPLTIQIPLDLMLGQSLPLTLASLVIIAASLVLAVVVFSRLQKRANRMVRRLLGGQNSRSSSSESPLRTFWYESERDTTPASAAADSPDNERGDVT